MSTAQVTTSVAARLVFGVLVAGFQSSAQEAPAPSPAPGGPAPAAFEARLDGIDAALKLGDYLGAIVQAKAAIAAEPSRFEGYYYAAYCLCAQGHFEEALPYARDSASRAQSDYSAQASELVNTITRRRDCEAHRHEAEHLLETGLVAKAAVEYEQAWSASHENADCALKAVDLYERVEAWVKCASILRDVMATAQDQKTHTAANDKWLRLSDRFTTAYQLALKTLPEVRGAEAIQEKLDEIAALLPDNEDEAKRFIMYLGRYRKHDQVVIRLGSLMARYGTTVSDVIRMMQWSDLKATAATPAFREWFHDMSGKDFTDSALSTMQAELATLKDQRNGLIKDAAQAAQAFVELLSESGGDIEYGPNDRHALQSLGHSQVWLDYEICVTQQSLYESASGTGSHSACFRLSEVLGLTPRGIRETGTRDASTGEVLGSIELKTFVTSSSSRFDRETKQAGVDASPQEVWIVFPDRLRGDVSKAFDKYLAFGAGKLSERIHELEQAVAKERPK